MRRTTPIRRSHSSSAALRTTIHRVLAAGASLLLAAAPGAADTGMFGNTPDRNMVSAEKGLPAKWDPATGLNVKWTADLGSQSYGGPVVAGGKVYVGTNNEAKRNPKIEGDRGIMMVFDAKDGRFLWQAAHPKLAAGRVNDWPLQGICSTPTIDGDRLWYVSNRAEVVCADAEGFADGENDGPFKTETETGEGAADFVWKLDMIGELDVFPHNLAASSPLVVGDLVYVITGNGVDEGHINIPNPTAPSFLAIDKKTGKLVWEANQPGEKVLHGQWSSPSYGVIKGRPQVIFPGGNGWLYAFEPKTGKLLWSFDCNPKDAVWAIGGASTRNNVIAVPVVHGDRVFVGVGEDPEHGEGIGHLWAIEPGTGEGDLTGKAVAWHRGGEDFHRTISTVAIEGGLVYAADLSGYVYCLDEKTGQLYWTYNAYAAIWGSPLVADGKLYIGDEDGDIAVLRTGKKMELLGEINLGSSIYSTPYAKDGVLYVASRNKLFALAEGIPAKPKEPAKPAAKPGGSGR